MAKCAASRPRLVTFTKDACMKIGNTYWLSCVTLMALGCGSRVPSEGRTAASPPPTAFGGFRPIDQAEYWARVEKFSKIPPLGQASPEFEEIMGSDQEAILQFIKKFEQTSGGITPNAKTIEFVATQVWPRCRRLAYQRYQQTGATQATMDAFMRDLDHYMPVLERMILSAQELGAK